jgi:hypothetical protein
MVFRFFYEIDRRIPFSAIASFAFRQLTHLLEVVIVACFAELFAGRRDERVSQPFVDWSCFQSTQG